jgi:glycosyltransferase involved in cell wall biosynthesis
MNLSVVIITRNRKETLTRVVESVARQTVKPCEVVIVDGSDVPSPPQGQYDKKIIIRYIIDKKRRIPYARNVGAKKSKGDIIFFVDDDCVLHRDAVERVVGFFRRTPSAKAVIGKTENGTPGNVFACVQHYYYERWLKSFGLSFRAIQKIPDGSLMDFELLAIRRDLLKKYSFDETLPFGRDEDAEIGVRICKETQDIYFHPFIIADHIPSQTCVALMKRNIIMGYTNAYLARRRNIVTQPAEPGNYTNGIFSVGKIPWYKRIIYIVLLGVYPMFSKLGEYVFFLHDPVRGVK